MDSVVPQVLNENDIEWTDLKSVDGKAFQVGVPKAEAGDASSKSVGDKKNFGIAVSWPPTGGQWVNQGSDVRTRAAITRYSLGPNGSSTVYPWILYFTNTEHYDYYFFDETGDSYEVNTYRNGDHWVRFASDAPDIVYIKGS